MSWVDLPNIRIKRMIEGAEETRHCCMQKALIARLASFRWEAGPVHVVVMVDSNRGMAYDLWAQLASFQDPTRVRRGWKILLHNRFDMLNILQWQPPAHEAFCQPHAAMVALTRCADPRHVATCIIALQLVMAQASHFKPFAQPGMLVTQLAGLLPYYLIWISITMSEHTTQQCFLSFTLSPDYHLFYFLSNL